VASGGEGGQGIYPVGQVSLPLHVQCLCYKASVRQDQAAFVERLRGWMRGGPDVGLDDYARFVGLRANQKQSLGNLSLLEDSIAAILGIWLFGGEAELAGRAR
jgi:hypothetical protein